MYVRIAPIADLDVVVFAAVVLVLEDMVATVGVTVLVKADRLPLWTWRVSIEKRQSY